MDTTQSESALFVFGISTKRGKGKGKSKIQSKSRFCDNIECYHCHKKGHIKKHCKQWKNKEEKEKKKKNQKEVKSGSSVKIEDANTMSKAKEGDIL